MSIIISSFYNLSFLKESNLENIVVDTGFDNIVHHNRYPCHVRILNSLIEDWESDILRTLDQDNEHHLPNKYNNLRLLDDEENQTYTIAPEIWTSKVPPEGISIIVWLGSPPVRVMGIVWTYWYQDISMIISWY